MENCSSTTKTNQSIVSCLWAGLCEIPQNFHHYTSPLLTKIQIVCVEGFAVLTGIIPNAIKWHLKRTFTNEIKAQTLKDTSSKVEKTATLYLHSLSKEAAINPEKSAILFLHGDRSHPSSMLHLINDVLNTDCGPVYSLQLDNSGEDPLSNQELIRQSINAIGQKVIVCGHSKGAMQGAHLGFTDPISSHIVAVHSIAGRLRIINSEEKQCDPSITDMVNEIFAGISAQPNIPLYQYVGTADWNAPQEGMIVRPETAVSVEGAMHLNILFAGIEKALIQNLQLA